MHSETPSVPTVPMVVGRYLCGGESHFLPVSEGELKRATDAVMRVLASFGLEMGRNVMVASLLNEVAQLLPFERALMHANLVSCNVDSTASDAKRFESVVRRFDLAAIAVLNEEILDGLTALGFAHEKVLAGPILWARPGAYERLRGLPGLRLHRWLELGPAVAMECWAKNGAHIDRLEWDARAVNGEIVLDSRASRVEHFRDFRTGVNGRVEHAPCACGNADPRIIVD